MEGVAGSYPGQNLVIKDDASQLVILIVTPTNPTNPTNPDSLVTPNPDSIVISNPSKFNGHPTSQSMMIPLTPEGAEAHHRQAFIIIDLHRSDYHIISYISFLDSFTRLVLMSLQISNLVDIFQLNGRL